MQYLDHAMRQFLDHIDRPEFVAYAAGNHYAELERAHAIDCMEIVDKLWIMQYPTETPDAVKIAGLYQDCDRWFPKDHSNDPVIKTARRVLDTNDIPSELYNTPSNLVKNVFHPRNCAQIFNDLNEAVPNLLKMDVMYLIELHEVGGIKGVEGNLMRLDAYTRAFNLNDAADLVRAADGLSFFNVILPSYLLGKELAKVEAKIAFSYAKLPVIQKEDFVRQMKPFSLPLANFKSECDAKAFEAAYPHLVELVGGEKVLDVTGFLRAVIAKIG